MLAETHIGGVRSNLAFLRRVLGHPAFAAAELDTGFIPRHADELLRTAGELMDEFWHVAAELFVKTEPARVRSDDVHSPWAKREGLRLGMSRQICVHVKCNGESRRVRLGAASCRSELAHEADGTSSSKTLFASKRAPTGVSRQPKAFRQSDTLYLQWNGELQAVTAFDPIAAAQADHSHQGGLTAPINGNIVRVLVEVGQRVEAGTALIVLEAMKMEHSIRSAQPGVVKRLFCSEGEMVSEGAVLLEMDEP